MTPNGSSDQGETGRSQGGAAAGLPQHWTFYLKGVVTTDWDGHKLTTYGPRNMTWSNTFWQEARTSQLNNKTVWWKKLRILEVLFSCFLLIYLHLKQCQHQTLWTGSFTIVCERFVTLKTKMYTKSTGNKNELSLPLVNKHHSTPTACVQVH